MPDVPAPATLLNNRYRLLAIIAGGGMATVYKAQDTQLNRVVAIKTLRDGFADDPLFEQRFREEAQAAAALNHSNIVTVHDVGTDVFNGMQRQYIVMEYVAGQDLKHARKLMLYRATERSLERFERRMMGKVEHLLNDDQHWQAVEWIAAELLKTGMISGRAAKHFYELATRSE